MFWKMSHRWMKQRPERSVRPWVQYLTSWTLFRQCLCDALTGTLEGCFTDVWITNKRYWREVYAEAPYPQSHQWLTEGYTWEGEKVGAVFPTCMKSIPRSSPPPKPAGLDKCDAATRQRWREDEFRYPPYHINMTGSTSSLQRLRGDS